MAKLPALDLPEELARFAEAQIADGRFTNMEQLVRAGIASLREQTEEDDADEAAWASYRARDASSPHDLTAAEASACLGSDDPEQQRVLREHLDALVEDIDAGHGVETTPAAFMAGIRARLRVPST